MKLYLINPYTVSRVKHNGNVEWEFKTFDTPPIPVVTCGDCLYSKFYHKKCYCHSPHWNWGAYGKPVDENGFCAWGK